MDGALFVFIIACVLLDVDGVLAEVSQSYRASIIETAAFFNVSITSLDIEVLKQRGSANNDWQVTHHFVQSSFPDVTLAIVTDKFEEIYHGTASKKGLSWTETLIPSIGLLKEIHRRMQGKVGLVTGRPRRDCQEFIDRFQ